MDLADSEEDPLPLYQVTYTGCKIRRSKEAEGGHYRSLSEGYEPSNDDHVTNLPQGDIYFYNSKNIFFEQKPISMPPPPFDNTLSFSAVTTTVRFRKAK